MKNYTFKFFLFLLLVLAALSCKKSLELEQGNRAEINFSNGISPELSSTVVESTVLPALGSYLTNVTFCSPMIVPLCAGQHINIGTVTVKTGSDDNVYVTYTLKSNWFIQQLHLYVGDDAGIPVNGSGNPVPGHFPYSITFLPPYTIQEYTFIIPNMPSTFTIAAHAAVVKISSGNGNIIDQQTAWGDGCDGTRIVDQGNWGTKFTYNRGSCAPPDICSKAVHYYFDSTLNGLDIPWVDANGPTYSGNVTIGGYDYSEDEGRAIYKTVDSYGMPDAKNGFINLATLRLSCTNYAQETELLASVTTIDAWLATCGKLSPTYLPTNNPAVRDAANYIHNWISTHICPDRR
jgi:hypothetical protein